ncbi:glucose 1-dehydrogenase [Polyangium sp. y55x31]|uniref:SDR family NAD(P)-dependent oxidoreductase n=1 Tax=Polyangium sp. y55x31 TaxID=3042688 RepID=UPI00248314BF|nr:glucose 1-dehydrogenase [Polyangium sp. y55x31]MDI1477792.1 glucose 1-dehydrogenase [Polyangium sp. y55x31]
MRFQGKVALVTGGTSGLGQATAEAFAREGAKVVLTARREGPGREVEASIRASGGDATFIPCDVTDERQIRALVEKTVELHGRLDVAYNNAWHAPKINTIAEFSTEEFDANAACLRGLFLCMRYEIQAMTAAGGGAIVNCSSAATQVAAPGLGSYSAAKAGLEVATRIAAHECASRNIRVNSMCTGSFDTPMSRSTYGNATPEMMQGFLSRIAMRRLGRLEEAAEAVLFLCSPAASFITGTSLAVDGGYLLT